MSLSARDALDRSSVPWLFAVALATTLPHALHLSPAISILAALLLAWGGWLWWQGARLPGRWTLYALTLLTLSIVLLEFHTLFGRQPGTSLLVLFTALKLMEVRSHRDANICLLLAYFVLLTHFFNSESMATGVWLLGSVALITASLIRLHGGPAHLPSFTLRRGALLTAQALPLMIVLYLLFPRISGPLWGLPKDAFSARTGLSGQMTPGSIADLAQNPAIAFRARFDGALPQRSELYWRGPVLDETDGATWRSASDNENAPPPHIEGQTPPLTYTLTLEAHQQHWLLALDAPTSVPPDLHLSPTLTLLSRQPLLHRQRYLLSAYTDYHFNRSESPALLQRALSLPPGRNPRTRALAERWRQNNPEPEALVRRALQHFRQEPFFYTLRPPLLDDEPMDEFIFVSRRGFCEHYAAAFVTLMRAARVPARVVAGYQGGELNPVDNHLVVRQSDAHAWAEVWLEGRGWTRVDPTAAVSPARIESGIGTALSAEEGLPALILMNADWLRGVRHRWEALHNGWNQWVLGYNPERQREFLRRFGIEKPRIQTFVVLLSVALGGVFLALSVWILHQRPRRDPAQQCWVRALQRLRRRGIDCPDWEAPLALAARLEREQPEIAAAMAEVVRHYIAARYGGAPTNLKKLRQAVIDLP